MTPAQRGFRLAILAALVAALLGLVPSPAPARAAAPEVSAPAAILVEPTTGDVLFERRAGQPRPLASVTKLMTALLTLEAGRLSSELRASPYRASAVESQLGLRPGERLTRADLLRGLLVESANDAAVTLAEGIAGSQRAFVRRMNRRARQLGLTRTTFADPIGLDDDNESSPRDLVRLTLELRRSPLFKRIVNRTEVTLTSGDRPRTIRNRNTLLRADALISGVKTGHTRAAGYNLVGSSTSRTGVTLISVVLGTSSEAARNADTRALLDYGERRYSRRRVVRAGTRYARIPIAYRRGAELDLVAARTMRRVLRRGEPLPTVRATEVPAQVEGPIRRGQRLGRAEVIARGRRVGTVALVAGASVPEAGVAQRTKDYVTRPLGFLAALLVVAVAGSLLLRRGVPRGPGRPRASARSEIEAT